MSGRTFRVPRSVRGVIFDLDGTLIDSYAAITDSLNDARATFGLSPLPAATVRAHVGRGLEALVADLVGEQRVAEAVQAFRAAYRDRYATGTFPLPGALTTVRTLRERGYRLGVASNKPARFGEAILRQLEILDCFDAVEGPDRSGTTKPDPAMIRACLSRMGVPAERALYVGDMELDVESGDAAGVPVVLVGGGSAPVERLRATGRPLLDSLGALLDLLPVGPGVAIREASS